MEPLAELRKQVQGGKLVVGTAAVMRLLKHEKLGRVFAASNCPDDVKAGLKNYCSLSSCELLELAVPNEELGVLCKKPFSISVVGVLR